MSNYTAAPATKMLASRCACCARALVDAESVDTGVGPVCREKHGYGAADSGADWAAVESALGEDFATMTGDDRDARALANKLVHHVACEQNGPRVQAYTAAIRALGFATLANRIEERIGAPDAPRPPAIEIVAVGQSLRVTSPYNPDAVAALRVVPGRRWDGSCNVFPVSSEASVLWALRQGYPGEEAVLSTGEVVTLQPIQPGEVAPVVAKPVSVVRVEIVGKALYVSSPYSPEATAAFRDIPGRRWDGGSKVNTFPMIAAPLVHAAIRMCYPDAVVQAPDGLFGRPEEADIAALGAQFGIEMDAAFA